MKKKLIGMLLAVSLVLPLTACGENGDSNKSKSEDGKETAAQENSAEDVDENEPVTGTVEKISVDNTEGTLTYTGHEVGSDYEGKPVLIVYFDYTNKKDEASYSQLTFYPQAFQNGVECGIGILMDENEAIANSTKEIQKDVTLNIAQVYELQDSMNPVTLKVTDQSAENLFDDIYQEQELALQ